MITNGPRTKYEDKDYLEQTPKGGLQEILARVQANNLRTGIRYEEGRLDRAKVEDKPLIAQKIDQLKKEHDDLLRPFVEVTKVDAASA